VVYMQGGLVLCVVLVEMTQCVCVINWLVSGWKGSLIVRY